MKQHANDLMQQMISRAATATTANVTGTVLETDGTTIAVGDLPVPVGASVRIDRDGYPPLDTQVIGFRERRTLVYPLANVSGVRRGDRARLVQTTHHVAVGDDLLGRVVNAKGKAIDGRPQPVLESRVLVDTPPPIATQRPRIDTPLPTGVRAIDALLTCGRGQRIGIFAGSGVGKSVLLGIMARGTSADVNVVALIGERGREVNEFIERDLGVDGLARSVVIVATSDEPAVVRVQAAKTALAIAEFFRDQGKDVLLLLDSLTRFAMAQREIGLAAGEPPTTRGYTPSAFATLPKLVERAGRSTTGSITGMFSVLVEGDDPNEPVADAVRGLLDGHIWLSRKLAARTHYPAIDVLESISRLMPDVTSSEHQQAARAIREAMAALAENEDLISIGAYRNGSNPRVDAALAMQDAMQEFLCQSVDAEPCVEQNIEQLIALGAQYRQRASATPGTTPPVPGQS